MHLKSLTLKGFKSFASATSLRFEPGITCVVGPNGSGKSNVVDAMAWVLGEQGAKALRGGKMEDVIFAGTAGRPPLGRAEVTLTIDNSDGALPIDYTEVSITRRMFRSGESEYEINGSSCRLLDIQELLSDSGIGREMHVIVGQGQLDSVLQAKPEDRRGFIEEAAGVLKHRKRKEKALRKLDAMQANLTRLTDLTGELRRQLKPLGRQAEVARRAATVQSDLRDARLRLLADDLDGLRTSLAREVADEGAVRERRTVVERDLAAAQARETELEAAIAADAPALARAQETWYRLSALEERFRGTHRLAAERGRHLSASQDDARTGRDPAAMEAEAAEVRAQEESLRDALEDDRGRLGEAVAERQELERALAAAERALVAAVRAVADRREGLARLGGQVEAVRTRLTAKAEEIDRLAAAAAEARERASAAQAEFDALQGQVGALDEGELGLDERHEAAVAAYDEARARVRALGEAEREAERDRATWTARKDALALGLTRKDGAGALLAAGARLPGLLGSVAALLTVRPGHEPALAAALGGIADAVAVGSPADAADALRVLKEEDGGRAGLLVGGAPLALPRGSSGDGSPPAPGLPLPGLVAAVDRPGWPALPGGAEWALDLVEAPAALRPALARALDLVAVVADLDAAHALVESHAGVRAVTAEGDLLGTDWAVGGSASAPSVIEVQAAVDEAETKLGEAETTRAAAATELAEAKTAADEARRGVDVALSRLNESDAQLNAVAEQLGRLGAGARSAAAEADRMDKARAAAADAREQDVARLADLEGRLSAAEEIPVDEEPSTDERDALQARGADVRQAEMEARLAVRTGEERVRALSGRADQLLRSAQTERATRARLEERRAARTRGAAVAAAVATAAQTALTRIAGSLEIAVADRDAAQQARVVREGELLALRTSSRELATELERLTDVVHRDEVARAEQRLRIEQLETVAVEQFGVDLDALVAEYGPDQPVPPSAADLVKAETEGKDLPLPLPYERAVQEKRAARAERDLALLGKVNPLALEEFAALEERHAFLSTQLEDLKATRRDLLTVVRDVDERIHDVFAAAYHDVAREFETVFTTLFPGGEGRLVLTDPDDMLATGIEVEARPPGKKVKRLSLLSGGERSLTAVALLVAIFRARPSPFYVMDEVEAALDDVNLGRLLTLIEELRSTSQIIIISHQKRTMEIADALYGVSMRGDGITTVISQRLRERESA
ncbi:MAG TPA: chromosome segregation protein SMC [Mycobacteriales bacterium]|nr:chromosome segregation protein SMC [Mycobacteriales bacterium]